jgi:HEAT repeat protein
MRQCMAGGVVLSCLVMAIAMTGCSDASDRLKSSDPKVAIKAMREVAAWENEKAVTILTDYAKTQPDGMLNVQAVRALGSMHRPEAAKALCDFAEKDTRATVRLEAITQLGNHRDEANAKLFEQLAKVDRDPYVRAAAITAIFQLKRLVDVPMLVTLAVQEDDVVVQARAVGAIEKLIQLRSSYNPASPLPERQKALNWLQQNAKEIAAELRKDQEKEKAAKGSVMNTASFRYSHIA